MQVTVTRRHRSPGTNGHGQNCTNVDAGHAGGVPTHRHPPGRPGKRAQVSLRTAERPAGNELALRCLLGSPGPSPFPTPRRSGLPRTPGALRQASGPVKRPARSLAPDGQLTLTASQVLDCPSNLPLPRLVSTRAIRAGLWALVPPQGRGYHKAVSPAREGVMTPWSADGPARGRRREPRQPWRYAAGWPPRRGRTAGRGG